MQAYLSVAVFMLVGVAFVVATIAAVGRLLRDQRGYAAKLSPYESGEDPVGDAQVPFHIRYYTFALVFVAFDVDTVFLYPWAVTFADLGLYAFIEMLLFIVVLLVGLVYAWRMRVLKWV
ncbi:MAG TPA: NADH-quinone oxidoreductase subunit A [Limnochordia bacterium]|nr:NADH-quinone oxidoreductase subunit A [Limnochordia bacterium]